MDSVCISAEEDNVGGVSGIDGGVAGIGIAWVVCIPSSGMIRDIAVGWKSVVGAGGIVAVGAAVSGEIGSGSCLGTERN